MPDVFFYHDTLLRQGEMMSSGVSVAEFQRDLKVRVAKEMDCLNTRKEKIVHDPRTQITIVKFQPIDDLDSVKRVVLYLGAFDWRDRMYDIDDRLRRIGIWVSNHLDLQPGEVDLDFIKLKRPPRPHWVNV